MDSDKLNDLIDEFGVDKILDKIGIDLVVEHFGHRLLTHLDLCNNCTPEDPESCLIAFKKIIMPRGYCDASDLKKLVCNWIDDNLIHAID